MKGLNPCPKCSSGVEFNTILVEKDWPSCFYKYQIICPKCGFEKRKNGKKNRAKFIEEWNNMKLKKWGKCDECGNLIFFKERYIHTEAGDHFCSLKCYHEREKYYHADAEWLKAGGEEDSIF